ncbi:hypothetical protein [Aliivibrio fischeri]|uniref:hypothetical protein n=1 Tax=Aliivibrio fischeri TaxID=668 RepID=UPI0007C4E097|nr:hypothetical protein [Aliivibrio fischeri]
MINKVKMPKPQPEQTKDSSVKVTESQEQVGEVAQFIGTGNNAQNSVVWLTIKWSFWIGIGITLIIVLFMAWFTPTPKNESDVLSIFPIDHIQTIWGIFVPIITLALGYMFGKGGK